MTLLHALSTPKPCNMPLNPARRFQPRPKPLLSFSVSASSSSQNPEPTPKSRRRSRKPETPPESCGSPDDSFPSTIPRKPRRGRRSEKVAVEDFVRDSLERTFASIRKQNSEVLDGEDEVLKREKVEKRSDNDDDDEEEEEEEEEDFLNIEEAEDETEEANTAETGDSDDHEDDSGEMQGAELSVEENPASDDSDGGMDDEAMFRMDSYLAKMFKERKNSMGSETAHSQLVLFKLRVLSLLEIYLHRNAGKGQVFTIYLYLAQAFINLHPVMASEQLGQRIGAILKNKILKAKDFPKGEEVQLCTLESLLKKSLKTASRARHKLVAALAQNSIFWMLKILNARNFPANELQSIMEIFQNVLVDLLNNKKCRLKSGFMREVFRRYPWIGYHLFPFLLEKVGSAKSEYRQVEALDMVIAVLRSCLPKKGDAEEDKVRARRFLKAHLPSLCDLVQQLLSKQLRKSSRRAEVRRFCSKALDIILSLNLAKPFVELLKPDAYAACEAQLGDLFLPFKKLGK